MDLGRAHIKSNTSGLRILRLEIGPLSQESLSFTDNVAELGHCFASTQAEFDWLVFFVDPNARGAQSLKCALLAHRDHYRYQRVDCA